MNYLEVFLFLSPKAFICIITGLKEEISLYFIFSIFTFNSSTSLNKLLYSLIIYLPHFYCAYLIKELSYNYLPLYIIIKIDFFLIDNNCNHSYNKELNKGIKSSFINQSRRNSENITHNLYPILCLTININNYIFNIYEVSKRTLLLFINQYNF